MQGDYTFLFPLKSLFLDYLQLFPSVLGAAEK